MSVCLPQYTGNSMRARIMSLWSANLSLAPSTINIYYLTNCPNIHTSVKRYRNLSKTFYLHMSHSYQHLNFSVVSQWDGRGNGGSRNGWRPREPSSKRQEIQALAVVVCSDLLSPPSAWGWGGDMFR